MHAIVSIHDVMPHTLERVQELLAKMEHLEAPHITLLVVPGLDWSGSQLDTLKQLQDAGYRLAGHGWLHRARRIRSLYHHFHAALISRQAAEHLSLDEEEISGLIQDCHRWFVDHDFRLPDLYVPPAWALGNINRERLAQTPFRYFESTGGLYDSDSGRCVTLPLAGFEADNHWRKRSLTFWNAMNKMAGTRTRPVRLSVHPNDHHLLLKDSLAAWLRQVTTAVPYTSVL